MLRLVPPLVAAATLLACQTDDIRLPWGAVTPAMPRNFSWVDDQRLAGMARPSHGQTASAEALYLADHGIRLLVSLTESLPETYPFEVRGIELLHVPVPDFTAPSTAQLDEFVRAAKEHMAGGGRVAVHCGAGMGRTGTFLAAWFVAEGMGAPAAIEKVRSLRPGSIETKAQEAVLSEYEAMLK